MSPDDDEAAVTTASLPTLPRQPGSARRLLSGLLGGRPARPPTDAEAAAQSRRASDTNLRAGSPQPAAEPVEGRSYVGVLRRISSMLTQGGQSAGAEDTKQHWLPDAVSRECYDCCDRFTTFRRRHHCRICGQIFCSRCCNQLIPGKALGYGGDLRVCTYCSKVVMTYVQNITSDADADAEDMVDLKQVLERVQSHLEAANQLSGERSGSLPRIGKQQRKKYSLGMQEGRLCDQRDSQESIADPLEQEQDLTYLTTLVQMIINPIHGVGLGNHRHRLKSYSQCLIGSEVVDWIISQRKVTKRTQAVALGQRLVDMKLISCVSHGTSAFRDEYCLYRPSPLALRRPKATEPDEPDIEEPHWLSQIELKEDLNNSGAVTDEPAPDSPAALRLAPSGSLYDIELDVAASVASISRSQLLHQLPAEAATLAPIGLVDKPHQYLDSASAETDPRRPLGDDRCAGAFEALESALLGQLLDSAGLPAKWYSPLLALSRQLSRLVKPDVRHECDQPDVRQFVKMKRIPGGRPADSTIVHGVVCRKNIVHNDMSSHVTNPQILLLNCAVSYQRYQDRTVSLEPMLMQERDVLRNITNLLISFAPDVIVVEKHVESLAREMLLEAGVTLVTNMKRQVLARIARCTQADVMGFLDAQLAKPALGICHSFYTRQFTMEGGHKNTLMFFEGCPSHLGCTVLLRGGHMNQLRRVKHVLRFMVSVQYNWLLQKSYLRDLLAVPPPFGNHMAMERDEYVAVAETPAGRRVDGVLAPVRCRAESESPDVSARGARAADERLRSPRRSGEMVTDHSDPLHCLPPGNTDGSIIKPVRLRVESLPDRNKFRKLLGDTVVCCTPYAKVSIPYLETDEGKRSSLRRFFIADLYWSVEFDKAEKSRRAHVPKAPIESRSEPMLLPPHPFLTNSIAHGINTEQTQALLTDFRARGGRLPKLPQAEFQPLEQPHDRLADWVVPCDALTPINHQKIALQTYTYARLPSGVAVGCCEPHIMVIMFNGDSDTTLGTFLENECFTPAFKCLKKDCVVPQEGHVQRFLHDAGCVSMSVARLAEPCPGNKTWLWTGCRQCDRASAARPMAEDTWTLSFGKFLETFFLCEQYSSLDCCEHSLFRDRSHYFGLHNRVAIFSHTVIQLNDIVLPQFDITVEMGPLTQLRLTEELHVLSEGVQLFSNIVERLLSMKAACSDARIGDVLRASLDEVGEEKTTFRALLTTIETMLAPLVGDAAPADRRLDETHVFAATDRAVQAKRMMADTVHKWNNRVMELAKSAKALPKPKTDDSDGEKPHKKPTAEQTKAAEHNSAGEQKAPKDASDAEPAAEDVVDRPPASKVKLIKAGGIKALKSLAWSSSELGERFQSPLPANEHHRLPATLPPSFISGDDIGSIIAYCMLTPEYDRRLAEIRHELERAGADEAERAEAAADAGGGARRSGGRSHTISETMSTEASGGSERGAERPPGPERGEKYLAQYHIDINMSDDNANFYCQVLLAEHFRRLRQAIFSAGEERFVRCLMYCKPWNAKGGKSGSTFQKSSDDRFVIKTVSKIEKDHFVRFGVKYVDYVLDSLTAGRPSVLAKILGVFLVGYKNNITGQAKKSYVIVMENLLYSRQISQKFDLKGSMRNRLADTKDKSEVVLLDQNMVTLLSENPLYVRPHAKRILMEAISRDTFFLQTCQVMDYSLLVGMDDERRCLVVGIIDYLRSYTYDKAVETYIKSYNILLGDGNNRPTVLDPVRYKTRFADMMNKYFTDVPDRWLGFAQGMGFLC